MPNKQPTKTNEILSAKESLLLNDLLDDLDYLEADNPYFALLAVDNNDLGEAILQEIYKKHPDTIIQNCDDVIEDFRDTLKTHQDRSLVVFPFYCIQNSNITDSQISQILIGPRDAITYYNLHIIVIVKKSTYETIFSEAYDLISFANFKASFHYLLETIEYANQSEKSIEEIEYEEALEDLKLYEKLKEKVDWVLMEKYRKVSDKAWKITNFIEALKLSQKGLKKSIKLNDKIEEAGFLDRIALCYYSIEDFRKTLKYVSKAEGIFRELNDKQNLAICLNLIGNIYCNSNLYIAKSKYEEAKRLSLETKDLLYLTDILINLGFLYIEFGKFHLAEKSLDEIIKSNIPQDRNIVFYYSAIALLNFQKGKINDFYEYENKALLNRKKLGFKADAIDSISMIANVHIFQGNYKYASELFKTEDNSNTSIKVGIDVLKSKFGKFENAIISALESLETNKRNRSKSGIAYYALQLGELYLQKNETILAYPYLKQAYRIYKKGGFFYAFEVLVALGDYYRMIKKYAFAKKNYETALRKFAEIGHPKGRADALKGLGEWYLEKGKFDEAKEHLKDANRIYNELGFLPSQFEVMCLLGKVYHQKGNEEGSRRWWNDAERIAKSLENPYLQDKLTKIKMEI